MTKTVHLDEEDGKLVAETKQELDEATKLLFSRRVFFFFVKWAAFLVWGLK